MVWKYLGQLPFPKFGIYLLDGFQRKCVYGRRATDAQGTASSLLTQAELRAQEMPTAYFVRNRILYWQRRKQFLSMNTIPCNLSPEVNECRSNPCQNGGTCTDQIGGYHCTCSAGSTGTECQMGEFCVVDSNVHSAVTSAFK